MASRFCGHCGTPNSATATFCRSCGRPLGRATAAPGAPVQPSTAAAPVAGAPPIVARPYPAPATYPAPVAAAAAHKARPGWLWPLVAFVAVLAMGALGLAAYLMRPQPTHCTGVDCTKRPQQVSVLPAPATYTSSAFGYSLDYYPKWAPDIKTDSTISWSGSYSDGTPFTYRFSAEKANGRAAQQIVQDIQQSRYAGATLAYALPDPNLGFTPGYGAVYDLFTSGGQATHQRVMIVAAVRGDVAVEFTGLGPKREATPNADGHPNPADVSFVHDPQYKEAIESVRWPGEPPL